MWISLNKQKKLPQRYRKKDDRGERRKAAFSVLTGTDIHVPPDGWKTAGE